jgi:hypothetical protein
VSAQNKLLKGIILGEEENLREYGMRILGIVRDASIVGTPDSTVEDWVTSYFLDGIKNRNIRTSLVLLRDSLGFFQLIDKAATLEDAEHSHMPTWNNRNNNAVQINKPWNNINLENDGNENYEQKQRMNGNKRNGWNNPNQQNFGRGNAMVGNPLKSKDGRVWSKSILREIHDAGIEECEKELIQVSDSERSKMEMHRNTNPTIGSVKFKENESKLLSEHCTKGKQMLMIVNESKSRNEANKSSKARLLSYCTTDVAYPWEPGESKIVHKTRKSLINEAKSSVKNRSTRSNPKFLPKGQSNSFGPDCYNEHGFSSGRRSGRSRSCPSDSRLLPAHDGCSSTLAADADDDQEQ